VAAYTFTHCTNTFSALFSGSSEVLDITSCPPAVATSPCLQGSATSIFWQNPYPRNVFHTKDIDAAVEKDKLYDLETPNIYSQKCTGIDSASGGS
jgi:hypothetical protein